MMLLSTALIEVFTQAHVPGLLNVVIAGINNAAKSESEVFESNQLSPLCGPVVIAGRVFDVNFMMTVTERRTEEDEV